MELKITFSCITGHDTFYKLPVNIGCLIHSPKCKVCNLVPETVEHLKRERFGICQRREAIFQSNFQWRRDNNPVNRILHLLEELELRCWVTL